MENNEMKVAVREAVREEIKDQQKKAARNVCVAYAIIGGIFGLAKLAQKTGADKKIKHALTEFKEGLEEGFKEGYEKALNK